MKPTTCFPLLSAILVLTLLLPPCVARAGEPDESSTAPNIVVIFIDDMGYADIEPFGGAIKTPHLNAMAKRGMRCTDLSLIHI